MEPEGRFGEHRCLYAFPVRECALDSFDGLKFRSRISTLYLRSTCQAGLRQLLRMQFSGLLNALGQSVTPEGQGNTQSSDHRWSPQPRSGIAQIPHVGGMSCGDVTVPRQGHRTPRFRIK